MGVMLENLGYFALASGLLTFLARSLFTSLMDRDSARFKADLERELDSFREVMRRESFEHSTRYASLYERRSQILDELYGHLVEAHRATLSLHHVMENDERREEFKSQAWQAGWQLQAFFERNQLYLDPDLIALVERVIDSLHNSFSFMRFGGPMKGVHGHQDWWLGKWEETYEAIVTRVPAALREIEALMRAQLGITQPEGREKTQREIAPPGGHEPDE